METISQYRTRIDHDRPVCACPDVRFRRGGSYRALNPDTGEVRRCCKHQGMIYAAYGWAVTRRHG